MLNVTIHTDGSSRGNPGPAGWAAVLEGAGRRREISGGEPHATNNQMEVRAILEGLSALKQPCEVTIVTDSEDCVGWLSGGFKRNNPAIRSLCRQIDELTERVGHAVRFEHVRGHVGHPGNERANALAQSEAEKQVRLLRAHHPTSAGPIKTSAFDGWSLAGVPSTSGN